MADFPDFKSFLFSKHSALYCTHFKIILYTTIKLFSCFCWVVLSSLHPVYFIFSWISVVPKFLLETLLSQLSNSQFIKMYLECLTLHLVEKRYLFKLLELCNVLVFWLGLLCIREIKRISNSGNRGLNRNSINFFTYKYFLLQQVDSLASFCFPSL